MSRELIASYTKKDFEVQTFRSGGPGGQHQNKTDSGVRIIHRPTGLRAESREERSQAQNKVKAFQRLATLVKAHHEKILRKASDRPQRSDERIRTYHEPRGVVKDHRTQRTYVYDEVVVQAKCADMIEETVRLLVQGGTND